MSGEIKKIDFIKNMAVFQEFSWDSSVRDKGNNVAEFKKINIFYARNYAGKTTLSRIIRALEIGSVSTYKYDSPEFQLSFDDGVTVTQNSLNNHGRVVRVFNEDFVKDNLSFIVDDEQTINSFAILGEDNTNQKREIEKYKSELGSEERKTGLTGKFLDAEKKLKNAKIEYDSKSGSLKQKLIDKANKEDTGIKHNKFFGDANYDRRRLESDINLVLQESYIQITEEKVDEYHKFLKEESKKEIASSPSFDLQYSTIVSNAKKLVETKIQVSDSIPELLNDALLAEWVRSGQEHHKDKRDKCAFCGSDLPDDLWEKLDKHFNREYEALRTSLERELSSIQDEKQKVPNLLKIKKSDFYSKFYQGLNELEKQLSTFSTRYCKTLEAIEKMNDEMIFLQLAHLVSQFQLSKI